MNILEKEIEDLIWQGITTCRSELRKRGLYIFEDYEYFRQVDLGTYGRADILGLRVYPKRHGQRTILFHIIEGKKDTINCSTLSQAARYCRGIQRILKSKLKDTFAQFNITLIGKTIDDGDFLYIPDAVENVHCYTYSLDFFNGIKFQKEYGYYHTKEQFPDMPFWGNKFLQLIKANRSEINHEAPF